VSVADRKTIQKRLNNARLQYYLREPESVARAAKAFGLDPNDVSQREQLLYKLADVFFGAPGKKGRPKGSRTSWGKRLIALGRLCNEIKDESPKLSDAKIAKLITKDPEFKHDDPEQIRQRLPEARYIYEEWCAEYEMEMLDAAYDYMAEHPDEFPQLDELDYP
jgi:hypothetical protein